MIETKILFLDIDGVLATDDCYNHKAFMTAIDGVQMPYIWNRSCCAALDLILNVTNCKIVLSSDWKIHYGLDEMKTIFEFYNIDHTSLIGFTNRINLRYNNKMSGAQDLEGSRTEEIKDFIKRHKISNWCAIDDLNLNLQNFVFIQDTSLGLNEEIMNKIIDKLNGKQ